MEAELGEIYRAINRRHEEALPLLTPAPQTPAEHTAWVDSVLEPWRADGRTVGIGLNELRPSYPSEATSDGEIETYERLRLVHAALSATLSIDERVAQLTIPIPVSLDLEDPKVKAGLRDYAVVFARDMRSSVELWMSACGYARGKGPPPGDLVAWQNHCYVMAELLRKHICAYEETLAPDAVGEGCVGE